MKSGAQRRIESTCIFETVIIKNTPIAAKNNCLVASAQELPLFCWYEKTLEDDATITMPSASNNPVAPRRIW
jgi:hypothetical protein